MVYSNIPERIWNSGCQSTLENKSNYGLHMWSSGTAQTLHHWTMRLNPAATKVFVSLGKILCLNWLVDLSYMDSQH